MEVPVAILAAGLICGSRPLAEVVTNSGECMTVKVESIYSLTVGCGCP